MRAVLRFGSLLVASSCLVLAASAQSDSPAVTTDSGSNTPRPAMHFTRAAYSYVMQVHTVRSLADGTTLTTDTQEGRSVDTHGRLRFDWDTPNHSDNRDDPARRHSTIYDPVAKISIEIYPDLKMAHVRRSNLTADDSAFFDAVNQARFAEEKHSGTRQPEQNQPEMEDLGDSTLLGYTVHGRRTVRVIPTGKEGNDHPIRVVQEMWTYKLPTGPHSSQPIQLRTITDDPRNGHIERVATSFDAHEPDISVFQVPSDFKVYGDPKDIALAQPAVQGQ